MCVKQQVKRKLYVEFRVTFTKILYSSITYTLKDKIIANFLAKRTKINLIREH
jgi:hypothetical protein